jgi:hypothetical protein
MTRQQAAQRSCRRETPSLAYLLGLTARPRAGTMSLPGWSRTSSSSFKRAKVNATTGAEDATSGGLGCARRPLRQGAGPALRNVATSQQAPAPGGKSPAARLGAGQAPSARRRPVRAGYGLLDRHPQRRVRSKQCCALAPLSRCADQKTLACLCSRTLCPPRFRWRLLLLRKQCRNEPVDAVDARLDRSVAPARMCNETILLRVMKFLAQPPLHRPWNPRLFAIF